MTKLTNKLMIAVAALAVAGVASAQTLKADIPFGFRVGEKVMAPGHYLVDLRTGNGVEVFRVYNDSEHDAALAMPNIKHDPAKEWRADGKSRLAFECVDSACALSEIWTGAGYTNAYKFGHRKAHDDGTKRVAVIVAEPVKSE